VASARTAESFGCSICQKVYDNLKIYQKHLKSRSHLQRLSDINPEDETEDVDDMQHLASVVSRMENLKLRDTDGSDSESESDSMSEEGESGEQEGGDDDYPEFEEETCLFCPTSSESLETNITHMQKSHGLFIPNLDALTDPYSFFAYLHTLITRFNECLSCSRVLTSPEAARDHMKDKGHCCVNVDGDEWAEFWEVVDEDGKGKGRDKLVSEGDRFQLPGGRSIRHRAQRPSRHPRRARIAGSTNVETEGENPNQERGLATSNRREMGIIGLSDVQKRSLRVAEKKMINDEMWARNESRAVREKSGNKQKHFRPDVPGPSNG
jgi:pre-60S factor REI1